MGKASDFPCCSILHSPHDIQITLFFNLDKSSQPVLVTEVNSQSWQISPFLPLLPDFYLHKIRTWHHVKKMCPHKISCWVKCTSPCATLCCISWRNEKENAEWSLLCKHPLFHVLGWKKKKEAILLVLSQLPLTGQLKYPGLLVQESLMVDFQKKCFL